MKRTVTVLTMLITLLLAVGASAHVTIWPQQSRTGAAERYTVRVPTERNVSTVSIELEVPAAVTVTGILTPAGFTYETKREGNRIASITWKQEIKPGEVGEFVFFARNPAAPQIVWRRTNDMRTVRWKTGSGRRAIAGRLRASL